MKLKIHKLNSKNDKIAEEQQMTCAPVKTIVPLPGHLPEILTSFFVEGGDTAPKLPSLQSRLEPRPGTNM